jgi:hypothetical protein
MQIEGYLPRHYLPSIVRLCGKLEMLDRLLPKLKATGHRVSEFYWCSVGLYKSHILCLRRIEFFLYKPHHISLTSHTLDLHFLS